MSKTLGKSAICLCLMLLAVAARGAVETSFEEETPGSFTRLDTSYGTWVADAGHAEIDPQHAKTGSKCLHLLGGNERSVIFMPKQAGVPASELSFWAERWTSRGPFKFRVEKFSNEAWEEVYNGDKTIKVGGFKTPVNIVVDDPGVTKYRFTSTTPNKSGVLIDDVKLVEPKKMTVETVTTEQRVIPLLIRNRYNPVIAIVVEADGALQPASVTGLELDFSPTEDLRDLKSVQVYYTGTEHPFEVSFAAIESEVLANFTPFGEAAAAKNRLSIAGNQGLQDGKNYFVVSVEMSEGADLLHYVDATCKVVTLDRDGGKTITPAAEPRSVRQPIGYAVRKCGDDGSRMYRIPGLTTTRKGTLIGVYDIRHRGGGDLPGRIDVGMSRSTDGGQSWEPMQTIMDMGDHDKFHGNGIGDPAVLVDEKTGTIWAVATWSHGNRSWRGSGPGLEPDETGQLMMVRSDDDGVTWSEPINVTRQVKDPAWCFLLQGPGRGITMDNGTIVFAGQYQDPPENKRMPHSTILYSRDHGETWNVGTGAKPNTTEAQVVELSDGSLMLNMRDNRGGSRSVYTSKDMGKTWDEHPTSRKALPEPVCMASLLKHDPTGWLLFSNPNRSGRPRAQISIKVSKDDGMTWPEPWHTLIDENKSAGYSCLTVVDKDTIGILYEGSRAPMTFQKFRLSELAK